MNEAITSMMITLVTGHPVVLVMVIQALSTLGLVLTVALIALWQMGFRFK